MSTLTQDLDQILSRCERTGRTRHDYATNFVVEDCIDERVARLLAARGFRVVALDHQGCGLSEGDRGHVELFSDFVADVLQLVTAVSPLAEMRGTFSWARTSFHEFTHVIHLGLSHNRCPRWITEGIATWEEVNHNPSWSRNMRRVCPSWPATWPFA